MAKILILSLLVFSLILIIITTIILRKGRIPIKYSLVWYFSSFCLFLIALFPNLLEKVSKLIGFKTPSNFLLAVIISLLLFIVMSLTIIVSGQKTKITLLIQELSILKSEKESEQKK